MVLAGMCQFGPAVSVFLVSRFPVLSISPATCVLSIFRKVKKPASRLNQISKEHCKPCLCVLSETKIRILFIYYVLQRLFTDVLRQLYLYLFGFALFYIQAGGGGV